MSPNPQQNPPPPVAPVQKPKKRSHPANPFILYFQDMFNRYGGNMYRTARECGRRWKILPQSEKDKYKRMYIANRAKYNLPNATTGPNAAYNNYRRNRVWPKVARRTVKPSKKQLALQAQQALQAQAAAQLALAQAQAAQAQGAQLPQVPVPMNQPSAGAQQRPPIQAPAAIPLPPRVPVAPPVQAPAAIPLPPRVPVPAAVQPGPQIQAPAAIPPPQVPVPAAVQPGPQIQAAAAAQPTSQVPTPKGNAP